ncbi:MAG TPA: hypothetical protein VF177_19760 [Anaerolineae bacterium]
MIQKAQSGIFWLLVLALIAGVAAALQDEPGTIATQNLWPSEIMLVRPEGPRGILVAYDLAGGSDLFALPAGILAAGESHYYTATRDNQTTQVDTFDPQSGKVVDSFMMDGQWQVSGVSPNGRWLALKRIVGDGEKFKWMLTNTWQTEIKIIAAATKSEPARVAHSAELEGNFEVEAIANDGAALYLIEHLPAVNPDHYLVRLFDLTVQELDPNPLRDKRFLDEVMTGYAWGSVTSPDGSWLLTLYVSTERNAAFIHALNLDTRLTLCLDLPSGDGDFVKLQEYALALSPDGRAIYAANPALGVVAELSLERFDFRRQSNFTPAAAPENASAYLNGSITSPDGHFLYFSDGHRIWAYDTIARDVRLLQDKETGAPIVGLAVSSDGERLYVAAAGQPFIVTISGSS